MPLLSLELKNGLHSSEYKIMKIQFLLLTLFFSKICFAEVAISQVDAQLAKALCTNNNDLGHYSVADRQAFLSQAEQNYDNLRLHSTKPEIKKEAQEKFEKIRDYIKRGALEGLTFWNVGTTCPNQIEFPNTLIASNSEGRAEALSRATSYLSIGLCNSKPREFSINARIEFLQAAAKIYENLKTSKDDLALQKSAQIKFESLQTTLAEVKSKGLDYWDAKTACPATNYSRSQSGPSLPAKTPYPPTAPKPAR